MTIGFSAWDEWIEDEIRAGRDPLKAAPIDPRRHRRCEIVMTLDEMHRLAEETRPPLRETEGA